MNIKNSPVLDVERIIEESKKNEPTFSYTEAAEILGVTLSTISHAVSNGRIDTVSKEGKRDKIRASEVIQYGIKKRGMDADYLQEKIREKTGANNEEIAKWLLIGLGAFIAYKVLNGDWNWRKFGGPVVAGPPGKQHRVPTA